MTEMYKGHLPERHTFSLRGYRVAGPPRRPATADRGPSWMTDPARICAPERGQSHLWTSEDAAELNDAALLCGTCPFIEQCGDYAVTTRQPFGVWGGKIRRQGNGYTIETRAPALVTNVSTVSPQQFWQLREEDQETLVRQALADGLTVTKLAQRLHITIAQVERLSGRPGPYFDDRLKALHADGLGNTRIGNELGVDPRTVDRYLERLGLTRNRPAPDRQERRLARDRRVAA